MRKVLYEDFEDLFDDDEPPVDQILLSDFGMC